MAETAVVDFIGSVSKLTDPDIVWASFSTFVKECGFTNGGLADMPGPHERLEQTLLYLNWPKEQTDDEEPHVIPSGLRLFHTIPGPNELRGIHASSRSH